MPTVMRTAISPLRRGPWSGSVTFQQIDPADGIQSLALSLTGTVAGTVGITSLDLLPTSLEVAIAGTVLLSRPDGSAWLGTSPLAFITGTLQPGVRRLLYAEGSATSSAGYAAGTSATTDAALLVGTGDITLPVTASARIQVAGPGNMEARFTSLAGAEVSLTAATGPFNPFYGGVTLQSPNSPLLGLLGSATRSQTLTAATATVGATSNLVFDAFDPMLGVLAGVTVSATATASGSAWLENLDPVSGTAKVDQAASITVQAADGAALNKAGTTFTVTGQMSAFDGREDFGGTSSARLDGSGRGLGSGSLIQGAGLGAFRAGPVALTVARAGSTMLDGPGNLHVATMLQAGGDVTVTYHFVDPVLRYTNTTTGQSGTMRSEAYAGPVAGLQHQHVWTSTDDVVIATDAPDVFLRGGAGTDALTVTSGSNVLDGGGGSNLLVGSNGFDGGHDTYFVDARGGVATWSTLVNFGAGDSATLFGFRAGASTLAWVENAGAAGHTGLTLHSETRGEGRGVDASLTFTGLDRATADRHLTVTTGTLQPGIADAADYLHLTWNR